MVTTQKLRVVFYLVGIFKTSSVRDSISSNVERASLRRRRGEEPGYREGLQQRAGSLYIKIVLDKKKKEYWELRKIRYPRLRNLAVFYVWEDARVWAG